MGIFREKNARPPYGVDGGAPTPGETILVVLVALLVLFGPQMCSAAATREAEPVAAADEA